jgi:NDP-sugar pyrophosphorylase family protein
VTSDGESTVTGIRHVTEADLWMNGGFFAFKREIFDYLGEGEELVEEPFARLIQKGALVAYKLRGFWACMDSSRTQRLDDMNNQRRRGGVGTTPRADYLRSRRPDARRGAGARELPPGPRGNPGR